MNRIGCVLISLLFSFPVFSQFTAELAVSTGLSFAEPDKQLGLERISGALFYRCSQSPFSMGVEVGQRLLDHHVYGSTIVHENYGLVSAEINEKSYAPGVDFVLRYDLISESVITPYAEVRAGTVSWVTTRKVSEGRALNSGEVVLPVGEMRNYYPSLEHHRTSFRAGLGAGVVLHLKQMLCATEEDFGFEMSVHTGLVYYPGFSSRSANSLSSENHSSHPVSSAENDVLIRCGLVLAF